jgi:hypothetical protein
MSERYASYKIVFTEDGKKSTGSIFIESSTTHPMDTVKQRDPKLHSAIIKFIEDFQDTNFYWGKRTDEYTTPKFEPPEEFYECPKCGYDDLPDDVVPCPNCK